MYCNVDSYVSPQARKTLPGAVVTPGLPLHFVASPSHEKQVMANSDKTMLDWWLLARSHTVLKAGGSSFPETAIAYRDAGLTDHQGETLILGDQLQHRRCKALLNNT